jgi:hypothetical protein
MNKFLIIVLALREKEILMVLIACKGADHYRK